MSNRIAGPLIIVAAAGVAAALVWHYWPRPPVATDAPVAARPVSPPAADVADVPPAPPGYPVEAIAVEPVVAAEPLPTLEDSDAGFLDALAAVVADARDRLAAEFVIPRLVATIDNLPRRSLTRTVYAARPFDGELLTAEADGRTWLDAGNAARYDAAVATFVRMDSRRLVGLYVHWSPLFERAWRDLGEPERRFNDRLVEVIDHLLAAPESAGPIELRRADSGRPRWVYADPARESASVGHKALWRLGPEHAVRVKAKLREIRGLLVGA